MHNRRRSTDLPVIAWAALLSQYVRQWQLFWPRFTAYRDQRQGFRQCALRALPEALAPTLAGVALLLALAQGQGLAATINVTGACTLIDAITAANTDTATGGCTAGSGADTIVLTAGSTHTLTAVNNNNFGPNGLPVVSSTIAISGNGSTVQRDGAAVFFRLLQTMSTGDLTVQDLVSCQNR